MLQSDLIHLYETGYISTSEDLHRQLAERFEVPVAHVDLAFARAVESLSPIVEMVRFVEGAKERKQGVRLFCMSNIGMQHWQYLVQAFPDFWHHFDGKFPSWASGMRKPDPRFFERVMLEAGIMEAAVALGCTGVLHKTSGDTLQHLAALLHTYELPLST